MEFWKDNHTFIFPSLFTVLNLISGILSIILAINGEFLFSAWMIIIAVLFDGLDGKIARWAGCETEFGIQLDSLADLVSSGVAPMLLIYHIVFKQMFWLYTWVCLLYVFAGTYRLARFNVMQKGDRSQGYIGLPIPVSGMSVAAFCLFFDHLSISIDYLITTILFLILSVLMVSTIPYAWPKLEWHQGRLRTIGSILLLICVAGMILFTKLTLFPLLCLYTFVGFGRWIVSAVRETWEMDILK